MDDGLLPPFEPARLVALATAGLVDARNWRHFTYVVGSCLVALFVVFPLAVLLLVPAWILCIVGVGIPLTVGAHVAVDRLVGIHRGLTRWVGVPVTHPPAPSGGLLRRFADGTRWRESVFALIGWLPLLAAFVAVVAVWAGTAYLLTAVLWSWGVDWLTWLEGIGVTLIGLVALVAAPWATRGVGEVVALITASAIGPDRMADARRRMAEIETNRDQILHAVADERRRIERNLHDGVQQQLVATGIDIGLAAAKLDSDPERARALLEEAGQRTRESIGELRVIGRGLHPAILGDRGLDAALSALVDASTIPVELRSDLRANPPLPAQEAAYFVVSEALTNVMKHSGARVAVVDAAATGDELRISVFDDGRGGAHLDGTGLAGIAARVRGLGGSFEVDSPLGGPTTVAAMIPAAGSSVDGGPVGKGRS